MESSVKSLMEAEKESAQIVDEAVKDKYTMNVTGIG